MCVCVCVWGGGGCNRISHPPTLSAQDDANRSGQPDRQGHRQHHRPRGNLQRPGTLCLGGGHRGLRGGCGVYCSHLLRLLAQESLYLPRQRFASSHHPRGLSQLVSQSSRASCKALNPVNMPGPIRKRFGYSQLWPLRPACNSQNRAGSYMPDPTSCIRFSSVFPKKAWAILCKTDPDPIWMAWSGFGYTHLVRKRAGVQESSGPVSGRTQPACYWFPIFRLSRVLPQTSWIISYKTSPDPIWFWLIVPGFGQTDPVRKQANVQESSGPLLANAFQPIRTVCESDLEYLLDRLVR